MSGTMDAMATDVDQQELAQQLLAQAREQGIDLVGPGGLLNRFHEERPGDRSGSGNGRTPRIRKARRVRAWEREFPQRHPHEDGSDRNRASGDRRAAGHRCDVRSADREKAAAPADRV